MNKMISVAPPPHFKVTKTLLKRNGIVVKQSSQTRVRFKINGLRNDPTRSHWMVTHLKDLFGVDSTEVRFSTGSVIVQFQPGVISIKSILASAIEQMLFPVVYLEQPEPIPGYRDVCKSCNKDKAMTLGSKVRKVLWFSGVMVYSLARLWIFRLPLVQTPFSFLGIVSMIGTIPLIKDAIEDTFEKKKLTAKPFLAIGSLVTIGMGEAFSALQVLWINYVAELTEDYVAMKSRNAIQDILEVAPKNGYVLIDGMEVETPVTEIIPGDMVVVHTGEKIPVDGVITEGDALIDEASINGRAEAICKKNGETVYAGTIVSQGLLFIETTKTGEETYLANIMRMVDSSLSNKAPVEQKADELASRLMKVGIAATALTLLLTGDPMRALTVMLVMSCPCATVLAASSAVTASVANAAKHQILIKGGLYLEAVGKAEVICFDKTGTLTSGTPEIVEIVSNISTVGSDEIIQLAATAESHNQHPMAKAILAESEKRGLDPEPHAICDFKAGRGVLCTVGDDRKILVGNQPFMEEHHVDVSWFDDKAQQVKNSGNTVVYVAKNGLAQGMLVVANQIRPEAVRVLNCLREDGVKQMHLVTGDAEEVARTMLDVFPFNDCKAGLMPEQKAEWIDEMKKSGKPVIMVGDGVNDALALAHADIGIAMGVGGAEVAVEAADIALADSNLESLIKVRNLSHQTMRVIDQNHYFAVSTDLFGVVLGMVGILSPVMAGLIHIIHTGGILLNSSRLLSWEPPIEPINKCWGCLRACECGNEGCKRKLKTC